MYIMKPNSSSVRLFVNRKDLKEDLGEPGMLEFIIQLI